MGKICDKLDKIASLLKKSKYTKHKKAPRLSSSEQVIDSGSAVKKVEGEENPENHNKKAADVQIETSIEASASDSEESSDNSSAAAKPIKTKMNKTWQTAIKKFSEET